MAELNLKQIEDKLNSEFTGDSRKLVFWYDDKGEFVEDIKNLELENAKIYYLTPTNLFKTKILLEREDTETNYLIYAPFPKPSSRDNHLADTIKYSEEFSADRISLIMMDLDIDMVYKPILQKYGKYFEANNRIKRFYDVEVDNYDENAIEISLLSALVKSKVANFEEVVRIVLTSGELSDNEYIEESKKYGLDEAFWKHISQTFAYVGEDPNLEKLVISLFLTYTGKEIKGELPSSLNKYLLNKSGTVITFMDQIMNSVLYGEEFDRLSDEVFIKTNGEKLFEDYPVDDIIDLEIFRFVDKKIIQWMIDCLIDENLNATIDGMDIPQLCKFRKKKHFGGNYTNEYHVLKHAFYIMNQVNYIPKSDIVSIIEKYEKEDYLIDTHYRKFYYYLDKVRNQNIFDDLQELVENVYVNKFLDVLTHEFNNRFTYEEVTSRYRLQRDFYRNYIDGSKESIVVIISDGLRYEAAKELVKVLDRNKKIDRVDIETQIGVLPSYTSLGMAALLPHKELTIDYKYGVYVDGKPSSNLIERGEILKATDLNAGIIQYDVIKKYSRDELRDFFVGKSVVYIYHNQIDARGDERNTEDEVLVACKEAIDEISELVIHLTNSVSRTKFIVTADHGFIYKREKLVESEKIDGFASKEDQINKRFIVSDNDYDVTGTTKLQVADSLGSYDDRNIIVPLTSNIFKFAGGGQNYVHGGCSPQEIIIPIVQIKSTKGRVQSENVKVSLISMLNKVTSLLVNLDFIQQEPISDVIVPTTYRISFVDDKGDVISNEGIYVANSKEKESAKRIFKLKFKLKDQKYRRLSKYYLVALDTKTGMEAFRHELRIDIAFADDFGFDI